MHCTPKSTVSATAVGECVTLPTGASPLTSSRAGLRRSRTASQPHSGTAMPASRPHRPSPACHEPRAPVTGAVASEATVAPTTSPVP